MLFDRRMLDVRRPKAVQHPVMFVKSSEETAKKTPEKAVPSEP